MPQCRLTTTDREHSLNLGAKSDNLWRRFFRRNYHDSVGLSPNYQVAFTLKNQTLAIYHLSAPPDLRGERCGSRNGVFIDTVLSNRYLVTLERNQLELFDIACSAHEHGLNKVVSKKLENQANENYIPKCLDIFDNGIHAWIAVGFRVRTTGYNSRGDIKIYLLDTDDARNPRIRDVVRHNEEFHSAIKEVRESVHIRRISFSPDGHRLACVTHTNKVLVWTWSGDQSSWREPFKIERDFMPVR